MKLKVIKTPTISGKTKKTEEKKTTPTKKKVDPALTKMVSDINKKFGENAVTLGFKRDENGDIEKIKKIPTGSFAFDIALGGGIPEGRMTQISGAYSSTKSSMAAHIIKNAQKLGYTCALVDVEGTSTEDYLQEIGVDTDSLVVLNPDSLEEATEAILTFQKSGLVQLAVLDSIAALSTNKEMDSSMEETTRIGESQRLLGEFCRKYTMNNNRLSREGKTPFTIIVINQLREKIGSYGDPEYTPGGRAIGFTITVDARLRRGDWISEGTGDNRSIVGQVVKFKVEKNKVYKRMQTGEYDFYFGENNAGIPLYHTDTVKEVITCGVERGVISREGSWFKYKDKKFQGLKSLVESLRDDEKLIEEIKKAVQDATFGGAVLSD